MSGWRNYKVESRFLEKYQHPQNTLESPQDFKEIKPVNPKGNQPLIFIGRTDADVEAPKLWPLDAKSRLTGEGPDAGED